MTFSGAYCSIAHDFCEDIGAPLPPLSPTTLATLKPQMPINIEPNNPLDLGTQPLWQPELLGVGLKALLNDAVVGASRRVDPRRRAGQGRRLARTGRGGPKRTATSLSPLHFSATARRCPRASPRRRGITQSVLTRSSDRMLRARGHVVRRSALARPEGVSDLLPSNLPELPEGVLPEWRGKQYLAAAAISTPAGALVGSVEEAVALAGKIGYPVVLKAQASALAHKTEAGGVILNLGSEQALRSGWEALMANVQRSQPGLALDGVLVEAMVGKGVELVVGARRDPRWGPVLLIGLGGILVEALRDVRLLPADASKDEIVAAFGGLKAAKLLHGFRNQPPADIEAAARTARRIGQLMLQQPRLSEIDINPLMVHARGSGATALDALIVTA